MKEHTATVVRKKILSIIIVFFSALRCVSGAISLYYYPFFDDNGKTFNRFLLEGGKDLILEITVFAPVYKCRRRGF